MYLEGVGIRSIERLEGASNSLIIYWIRRFSALIRKEIRRKTVPDNPRDVAILEVGELYQFPSLIIYPYFAGFGCAHVSIYAHAASP